VDALVLDLLEYLGGELDPPECSTTAVPENSGSPFDEFPPAETEVLFSRDESS